MDSGQRCDEEVDLISSTHNVVCMREHEKQEQKSLFNHSSRNKRLLAVIICNTFFAEITQSIPSPIFPAEAKYKGLSVTECGFIFGIFSLVQCIMCLLFGKYMSDIGVRNMALYGQVFSGIFTILFGLLHYIPTDSEAMVNMYLVGCLAMRVLMAISVAAMDTALFALAAETFKHNLAIVFGILETVSGISYMLAPGISGIIYQYSGYVTPYMIIGVLSILIFPFGYFIFPEYSESDDDSRYKITMMELFVHPAIIITMLTTLSSSIICVVLDPTLEPELRRFRLSSSKIGGIFLLMSSVYAIASPITGWITDRTDKSSPLLIVGFLMAAVGMLILGPSPVFDLPPNNLGLVLVAVSLTGMSNSFCLVPTYNCILSSAKKIGDGKTINYALVAGIWQSTFAFGGFIGPIMSTWSVQHYGFAWMTTGTATLCLLMVIILTLQYVIEMISDKENLEKLEADKEARRSNYGAINDDTIVVNVL